MDKDYIINEMHNLIDFLNQATEAYDKGEPIMSDADWDKNYFQLERMERLSGIILPESPTAKIHFEVKTSLSKVKHDHPMLSLAKTKSVEEVKDFLGRSDSVPWVAMAKMDGLTCSLTYENGVLVKAETRGDGNVGEDILHNMKINPTIPKHISYKQRVVLDGEIICTYKDFKEFESEFKNPRNFAAGSIRLLDAKVSYNRKLTFVVWDVIEPFDTAENTLSAQLQAADMYGFEIVPYWCCSKQDENLKVTIELIKVRSEKMSYPIDGVVFKYDDLSLRDTLGSTAHHFNNAIAYKFEDELYDTTLKSIEWTMGRTGVLTPVAVFEPVDADGSIVERASLHNISVMEELLGPRPPYTGQPIRIYKANMIIPQVYKSPNDDSEDFEIRWTIPKTCPICAHKTQIKENEGVKVLVCTNSYCPGLLINRLDHYLGKKGLDAKGISVATLGQLIEWGWVNSITDIYHLDDYASIWEKKDGFGPKSVENVLTAIKTSSHTTFERFLCALGIPLIGATASRDLAIRFKTYNNFRDAIKNNFQFFTLPNYGWEKHNAIMKFNYDEADELAKNYIIFEESPIEQQVEKSLEGKTIVITGRLRQYPNRAALQKDIEKHGGKVVSTISSRTDYLINNDITSTSTKNAEAKKLNIPIISEDDFKQQFLTL